MRCGTSTGATKQPSEPRRSKRQRIDLTLEEGFDRHELERALRQSLQEERIRVKTKPFSKKLRAEKGLKGKAAVQSSPKKKLVDGEQAPGRTEENKKTTEKTSFESSPEGTKPKNKALKRKQVTPETKCNEDIIKPEPSVSKEETAKKSSSKKQASNAALILEEAKQQTLDDPEKEKAVDDPQPQNTSPDDKIRRLSEYPTPTRASDLITLLACTKEVLGDHEYSSDQD
ncbi:hypothetical protein KIN20_005481 [Parelaphostrongylus tenuis]|uniref:Uncharacterized protein n=1 Tax=Parelaphostrongylus tenuis TaxID=148309 RepID=A0AAD5QF74_PARTN|nr:hypothetical protein KIN20_005481 [Parelaphostrongylus tenuis]